MSYVAQFLMYTLGPACSGGVVDSGIISPNNHGNFPVIARGSDILNHLTEINVVLANYAIAFPGIAACVNPPHVDFLYEIQTELNGWKNYVLINNMTTSPYIVVHYHGPPDQIKRIQRYKFTKQDSPQSLCSLKETGYTKITGFKKWSL